jgi:hypothetical protein
VDFLFQQADNAQGSLLGSGGRLFIEGVLGAWWCDVARALVNHKKMKNGTAPKPPLNFPLLMIEEDV